MPSTARKIQPADVELSPPEIRELYPEFARTLAQREAEILVRVAREREQISEQVLDSPGDVADVSVSDMNMDFYLQRADGHRQELKAIRDALDRMHEGIFGICNSCKNPISLERLRRMPTTRLCIDCQSALEAGRGTRILRSVSKI